MCSTNHKGIQMNQLEKQAYSIAEFAKTMSLGRTRVYQEIKEGRLQFIKVGKRTLIPAQYADNWLRNCGMQ